MIGRELHRLQPKVKRQVVAGFIVFRRTSEGIKFLLLYRRGMYWGFPKGHFGPGDNALRTALRETEEETGLKPSELRIVSEFRTNMEFHFYGDGGKIFDRVILYLAETHQPQIRISPREHSGFAWFLYRDAMRILGKYMATKKALKEAHDFIRRKSARYRQANPSR